MTHGINTTVEQLGFPQISGSDRPLLHARLHAQDTSRKDGDGTNEQLPQAQDSASGTRATTLVPLQGKMGKYQPMLKRTQLRMEPIDRAFFANGLS